MNAIFVRILMEHLELMSAKCFFFQINESSRSDGLQNDHQVGRFLPMIQLLIIEKGFIAGSF